ncbi:MAG: hypothetical protein ACRCUY_01570, partial [Thermoguttaceae bacterium]
MNRISRFHYKRLIFASTERVIVSCRCAKIPCAFICFALICMIVMTAQISAQSGAQFTHPVLPRSN